MKSTTTTPTVSTLVFDFGRVITRDQNTVLAAEMASMLGASPEAFAPAYYGERSEYDRGSFGAEGYWTRVASRLGTTVGHSEIARLVELDMESWFVIDPAMTDFIADMKARVARLVLLSNIPFDGAGKLRRGGYGWVSLFDGLVLSCEHRVIKPERAIYEICIAAAGTMPERCLLVDDVPGNIAGARDSGMQGHVYAGIPALRSELERNFRLVSSPQA